MKSQRKKEIGKTAFKGIIIFLVIPILLLIFLGWYFGVAFFILTLTYKTIKIKARGYFTKNVKGEEIKTRLFFHLWKKGIEGITPLQQAFTMLIGSYIMLFGVVGGMVVNAVVRMEDQWIWVEVILAGSLLLIILQIIGGLQKYWRFKEIDKIQKELEGADN